MIHHKEFWWGSSMIQPHHLKLKCKCNLETYSFCYSLSCFKGFDISSVRRDETIGWLEQRNPKRKRDRHKTRYLSKNLFKCGLRNVECVKRVKREGFAYSGQKWKLLNLFSSCWGSWNFGCFSLFVCNVFWIRLQKTFFNPIYREKHTNEYWNFYLAIKTVEGFIWLSLEVRTLRSFI